MPINAPGWTRAAQGGAQPRSTRAAGSVALDERPEPPAPEPLDGRPADEHGTGDPERRPAIRIRAAAPATAEPLRSDAHAATPEPPRSGARAAAPATAEPPRPGARAAAPATAEPHRPGARRWVKPYIVVVAMDLSEPGGRAWRFAFDLAALRGETEIHAVVVGPRQLAPAVRDVTTPGASSPPALRVLQHRFADGQPRLMAMHFRTGRPDRAIVSLARELSADLIVVATHPTSQFQRLFGGSTADRIARNAPCPVVVVRPKEDDNETDPNEYDPRLR